MFSAKPVMAKASTSDTTFISADCELQGELLLNSDTRIDGQIRGKLLCSKVVILGPAGRLQGTVSAAKVTVQGAINGQLYASEVNIRACGSVEGDIYTDSLCIEPGGRFIGEVHPMPAPANRPQPPLATTASTAAALSLAGSLSN